MECVVNIITVVALYAGKPELLLVIKRYIAFLGSETSVSIECVVNIVPVVALYARKPDLLLVIKRYIAFCRF